MIDSQPLQQLQKKVQVNTPYVMCGAVLPQSRLAPRLGKMRQKTLAATLEFSCDCASNVHKSLRWFMGDFFAKRPKLPEQSAWLTLSTTRHYQNVVNKVCVYFRWACAAARFKTPRLHAWEPGRVGKWTASIVSQNKRLVAALLEKSMIPLH